MLDSIGAPYLERNLAALASGGRLVLIGLMGGAKAEINLGAAAHASPQLIGSTLRARPVDGEGRHRRRASSRASAPALERGAIRPSSTASCPLAEAAEAHRVMKASEHFGKIVLRVA